MGKPKIYLDTSVISFYFAEDAPEKMPITREFINELLPQGKYEVCISSLVLEELGNTKDDTLRLKLLDFANELKVRF